MITLLVGENGFEASRAVDALVAQSSGTPERISAEKLSISDLPALVMGVTLFASQRLIIIRQLSDNTEVWNALPNWLDRLTDDIHIVLIESKPDKRTKTYKILQKEAVVREFLPWTDRDRMKAEQWVAAEAVREGVSLDKKSAQQLVERVGVDQWLLSSALQKFVGLKEVTGRDIEHIIDARSEESVFVLFEAALQGRSDRIQEAIRVLRRTEDPYMLMGLLGGQAFQLAVLTVANRTAAEVAKLFAVHPFALSKLAPYVKKLGKRGGEYAVYVFAEADSALKTSAAEPWLLVERALLKLANFQK